MFSDKHVPGWPKAKSRGVLVTMSRWRYLQPTDQWEFGVRLLFIVIGSFRLS